MHKSKVKILARQYNTLNPKKICPTGYKISLVALKKCKYTHGERSPVKPNELDNGIDNPKGRQVNRRVEIHRSNDSRLCNRCNDKVIISHGVQSFKEADFTNTAMRKRCLSTDKSCKYHSQSKNKILLARYMNRHAKECHLKKDKRLNAKSNNLFTATPSCMRN